MSLIVPAVLPSSRKDFEEKLALVTRLPVSHVQIDVVDGTFASPASWPYTAPHELEDWGAEGRFLPALDHISYEIDLMCLNPERALGAWVALGASRFAFHAESMSDISRVLRETHAQYGHDVASAGLVAFGLALNIESDCALIEPCLDQIDYVQFMGIARIGRQGQPFDERVLEKVRLFHERHPSIPIQVDGGVSLDTVPKLLARGVGRLVVGSALLHTDDPFALLAELEALQSPFAV